MEADTLGLRETYADVSVYSLSQTEVTLQAIALEKHIIEEQKNSNLKNHSL